MTNQTQNNHFFHRGFSFFGFTPPPSLNSKILEEPLGLWVQEVEYSDRAGLETRTFSFRRGCYLYPLGPTWTRGVSREAEKSLKFFTEYWWRCRVTKIYKKAHKYSIVFTHFLKRRRPNWQKENSRLMFLFSGQTEKCHRVQPIVLKL